VYSICGVSTVRYRFLMSLSTVFLCDPDLASVVYRSICIQYRYAGSLRYRSLTIFSISLCSGSSLCVLSVQVQYHLAKKRDGRLSARVETLLRDLERDVARRERFLRECARMVGAAPHLEQEVGWRMEHVLTKWDMLAGLRLTASRNNNNNNNSGCGGSASDQLPEMYADIELEVRSILNMFFSVPNCIRRFEGCHG
jgi:hypothetical protein